jgi:hypothetical protein
MRAASSTIRRSVQQAVWRAAPGRADALVELVGLKRSGLHGVAFWLLGHERSHALVNNRPARVPGEGSGMIRTDPRSPLPVHTGPGARVSVVAGGEERPARLGRRTGLVLVLHQSQDLTHLAAHQPRVEGIRADRTATVVLLRDPFNWAASYIQRARHPDAYRRWPAMWLSYARELTGATDHLGGAEPVLYNRWFVDARYRAELATRLGFSPTDANLNVVGDHGRGSSFDTRAYDGRAQQMAVASRWKALVDDDAYRASIRDNPEVVDLAAELVGLSPDLRRFLDRLATVH